MFMTPNIVCMQKFMGFMGSSCMLHGGANPPLLCGNKNDVVILSAVKVWLENKEKVEVRSYEQLTMTMRQKDNDRENKCN